MRFEFDNYNMIFDFDIHSGLIRKSSSEALGAK